MMVPEVGCSKPERIFISVDLPAPFSPMMACTSPGRTSKSTLNSTGISPKDFEIRFAERIGGTALPGLSDMQLTLPQDATRDPRSFVFRPDVKVFTPHVKVYTTRKTYSLAGASG